MKGKSFYLPADGDVQRREFHRDIRNYSKEKNISIAAALAEFFAKNSCSKWEMARFALHTSYTHNIVDAAAVLLHALGLDAEKASKENIMVEYYDRNPRDPSAHANSWIVDDVMGWPHGTVMPSSRRSL